jgi:hypothetical protein
MPGGALGLQSHRLQVASAALSVLVFMINTRGSAVFGVVPSAPLPVLA